MPDGAPRSSAIPAIDIGPFLDGDAAAKSRIAAEVAAASERIGFVIVSGHRLPPDLLANAFTASRAFFRQPAEAKQPWGPVGTAKQRGWHGMATRSLAKTIGLETPPDLRESIFLGPIDDHRAHYAHIPDAASAYAPNILPDGPQDVGAVLVALYRGFERLSADLLRIFALALDLPEDRFARDMTRHFSIMGCHYYPPQTEAPLPGQERTGPHTDFGAMTILAPTAAAGGLEARLPDGRWSPVQPGPGELVVNLGDMMARWTNDRWQSTLHRVVNPPSLSDAMSERQSIGFFVHPNEDAAIACIPTCLAPGESPKFPPITAGEHIRAKIAASHVKG
jgi:isopenicillin N synthase-like dioxygenase